MCASVHHIPVVLMRVEEEEWRGKVREEECSGAVRHDQRRHDAKKYCLGNTILEWRKWIIYGEG